MAETLFSREAGRDLYSAAESAPGLPRTRYLLRRANPSVKDQLTLSETWPGTAETDGFYLFLQSDLPPAEEASLARQLRAADFAAGTRFLWVTDTGGVFNASIRIAVRTGATAAGVTFALGNLRLELDGGCSAAINAGQDGFVFAPAGTAQIRFRMRQGGEPLPILTSPVTLTLAGGAAGAPGFAAGVDGALLAELGGDLRYSYLRDGAVEELRYPLFTLPAGRTLALDAWLDPFRPRDANRTRFAIRDGTDALDGCFATPAGQPIALRPQADAALVLCARPVGTSFEYYLAPSGAFGVPAGVQLMCGLQGTEYVRPGGRIRFVPGMPAFAPTFPARDDDSSQVLLDTREGTATTAWLLPLENGGPAGYFAQPATAAYFGRANASWARLTEVVPVRVADYGGGQAEAEGEPPLPAAPYRAATVQRGGRVSDGSEWNALAEFEEQVLAPNRWRVAPFLSRPRFGEGGSGPTLLTSAGSPTAITPQGFLAVLNEDGSQRELVLARSADGSQRLWFEAPSQPGITAALQLALLSSEVFLVVSRAYAELGTFHSRYALGGFTFDLAPAAPADAELRTILIFKFRDLPLEDLVEDVNLWTAPQSFNDKVPGAPASGAADRYPVQDTLRQIIRDAEASEDPHLQDFVRHVVKDASWRGVLALNAGVAGLRPELEAIRGGMTQPLVGHHVGIELNQVTTDPAEIAASSLFGLIHYPPAPPAASARVPTLRLHRPAPFFAAPTDEPVPDQDFVVDELTVVFRNSDVVDFRCAISLILNRMFGRPLERVPAGENGLKIAGAYQSHGNVGSFALQSAEPVLFRTTGPDGSPRVLRCAGVQGAQFVTVGKEPVESSPGVCRVTGRFVLTGGLGFAPDVFPVPPAPDGRLRPPLDLFGYGGADGSTLLPYGGLRLDYSFEVDAAGQVIPGTRTPLRMDTGQVAFTPPPAGALRSGSFVAGLPLQLVAFRYDPDGLRSGGKAVQIPALGDRQTRSPHYGLEFQLPLGSLGSMSTVGASLSAGVVLGWGPSETVADDDAAAVLVSLPALTPGVAGYSFQGVLRTTFGDGNLARFLPASGAPDVRDEVYALLFNNVALSLFGITLPPGVVLDFALFADPRASATPSLSNLGWYLAYAQDAPS